MYLKGGEQDLMMDWMWHMREREETRISASFGT